MGDCSAVSTLSLYKTAGGDYIVGGVASSFHRDLDGEAITPEAVRAAIPDFMAPRSQGIQGGAIRLHHNFWDRLLKRVVQMLPFTPEERADLVGAIALPLGRVTEMWVDDDGKTHWKGILSRANPIARVVWNMLQEGLIHLGVSLGGKIFETSPGGRDKLGRLCTLITKIRIDELSVTDNPALRLPGGEDEGAYIGALAKSARRAIMHPTLKPKQSKEKTRRFLLKAIGSTMDISTSSVAKEEKSGDWGGYSTGLGDRGLTPVTPKIKHGNGRIAKYDESQVKTGLGNKIPTKAKPKASDPEPKTDVFGLTVQEMTQNLYKACSSCKTADDWGGEEMAKGLLQSAIGLSGAVDSPPIELVNFAKFLQYMSQFAAALPHMSDYQQQGTIESFGQELTKALDTFTSSESFGDLKGKPLRPPGRDGVVAQTIMFPQQYAMH